MKKITSKIVLHDYARLKKMAKLCFTFGCYSWAMDVVHSAAMLMYHFNVIYHDEEMEGILQGIARKKISVYESFPYISKRVVFYDYFSLDNRGLTEQYIQGLIDNDYEILYVSLRSENDGMEQILKEINTCKKSTIYFVRAKNNIQKCREIVDKIIEFKPSKIFYHSAPWDTVGFIVMAHLGAYNIERFLINLTDHAFWLGCRCSDYFLEFRSYGVNISLNYRHIKQDQLLILPYYPIQNLALQFQGFPFSSERKRIIISGGSLYKIYGDTIFFDIVKWILDKYEDVIFFYLGNGDTRPLNKFIKDNQFEDRFFYSRERKDINEIINRCHFYLGSYPICGGLMSQIAVANHKIPIAYTDSKYKMNNIDELFINNEDDSFVFCSIPLLYNEIDKLMTDHEYYINKTKKLENKLISKSEFGKLLRFIVEKKISPFIYKEYDIDIESFSKLYFDQENYFLNNYENIFFIRNPLICMLFINYSIKKIFNKIMKRNTPPLHKGL